MPVREFAIEQYLVKRVKELNGGVRKVRWVSCRGAPDRFVMLPGAAVWVELKAPGEKPKPHQLREHERMRAAGQRVEVISSFEGVDKLLSDFNR
jgi:hypothetical protein